MASTNTHFFSQFLWVSVAGEGWVSASDWRPLLEAAVKVSAGAVILYQSSAVGGRRGGWRESATKVTPMVVFLSVSPLFSLYSAPFPRSRDHRWGCVPVFWSLVSLVTGLIWRPERLRGSSLSHLISINLGA